MHVLPIFFFQEWRNCIPDWGLNLFRLQPDPCVKKLFKIRETKIGATNRCHTIKPQYLDFSRFQLITRGTNLAKRYTQKIICGRGSTMSQATKGKSAHPLTD